MGEYTQVAFVSRDASDSPPRAEPRRRLKSDYFILSFPNDKPLNGATSEIQRLPRIFVYSANESHVGVQKRHSLYKPSASSSSRITHEIASLFPFTLRENRGGVASSL